MALVKTPLVTTNGIQNADGTPLSMGRIVFELDGNDVDSVTKDIVLAGKVVFTLDTAGKLPTGVAIWSNLRGVSKTRWKISLVQVTNSSTNPLTTVLIPTVEVDVPDLTTPQELVDIIQSSMKWPGVLR